MSEQSGFSTDSESLEGMSIPNEVRNEVWDLIESLTENYRGRRLKTIEKTADSVAAFFGGPSMGQSHWARECVEALASATGENVVNENESDLQALRRLLTDRGPRWFVWILEFLLQTGGQGRDDQVNEMMEQHGVSVRFTNGTASTG